MKKPVIIFLLTAAITLVLMPLPGAGQQALSPHENPATTPPSLNNAALILNYAASLRLALRSEYGSAGRLIDDLDFSSISDEMRFLSDRFNTLFRALFTALDTLEGLLDSADALLLDNRTVDARKKLSEAESTIAETRFITGDLRLATASLSDRLNAIGGSAPRPVQEAYDSLVENLERLELQIERFQQLRQSLSGSIDSLQENLLPTAINLVALPKSAYPGEIIYIYGKLNDDNGPLAGRVVRLELNNTPAYSTTNKHGLYVATMEVPYRYAPEMVLRAFYIPSDSDATIYLASSSQALPLRTLYYPASLSITAPLSAHPGKPFAVTGSVSGSGPETERTLNVLLGEKLLAEKRVKGDFSFEIVLPPEAGTGWQTISFSLAPLGPHSGASKDTMINLMHMPVRADIALSKRAILPLPLEIQGSLADVDGAIAGSEVRLRVNGKPLTVRTDSGGNFAAALNTPFNLAAIYPQDISVIFEFDDPWHETVGVTRSLWLVNPFTTAVLLAALLGILYYARRITAVTTPGAIPVLPPADPLMPVLAETRKQSGCTGLKGRILGAYYRGVKAVAMITNRTLSPDSTIREFVSKVSILPSGVLKPFTELSYKVEEALYSPQPLNEGTVSDAEHLSGEIEGQSRRGTP